MNSKKIKILLIIILLFPSIALGYTPPIGIPDPGWGVDTETYNPATHCPNWYLGTPKANTIEDGGADCYYIDNEQSTPTTCTDTGNSYGWPGHARCSLPPNGELRPGTYVELHGGSTYANGYTRNGSVRIRYHGTGTTESPIIFSGKAAYDNTGIRPTIKEYTHLGYDASIAYFIWEYMKMDRVTFEARHTTSPSTTNFLVIRHNEIVGDGVTSASFGVGEPYTDESPDGNAYTNIIAYHNTAHDGGYSISGTSNFWSTAEDPNTAGFGLNKYVNGFWVIDNTIYNGAADGVYGGHSINHSSENYYIGRNAIYNHKENCIDVKSVVNVIISENHCYNLRGSSSGAGSGIVVHYGGTSDGPYDTWVLYNTIHDSTGGIAFSGEIGAIYVIGNLIYDIKRYTSLYFTGGSNEIESGDIVTGKNSGATAQVEVIGLASGTWSGDGVGQMILYPNTITGQFIKGETLTLGGIDSAVIHTTISVPIYPYDPSGSFYPGTSGGGVAIQGYGYSMDGIDYSFHILDNIIYNTTHGIAIPSTPPDAYINGNIFLSRNNSLGYDILIQDTNNQRYIDYNLFYSPDTGGARIGWGSTTAIGLSDFKLEEKCTNCIESNPLITVKDGKPTSITIDSPARNANTGHDATIYTLYNNTYGVSITKDIKSVLRPKESTWDIGAYEYDPATVRSAMSIGAGAGVSIGSGATMTLY